MNDLAKGAVVAQADVFEHANRVEGRAEGGGDESSRKLVMAVRLA